jgi:hypothetical protein
LCLGCAHKDGRLEVPGGDGHAEVDPAAAADDAINITRIEEVTDHHLGAGGSQGRSPFVLAPHHGANPKPSIEEQAGDSASDRLQLARGPVTNIGPTSTFTLLPRTRQLPGSVVSPRRRTGPPDQQRAERLQC